MAQFDRFLRMEHEVHMIRHHNISKQLDVELGPEVIEMVEKKAKDVVVCEKTVSMITRESDKLCGVHIIEMAEFGHGIG
jgi:predicted transcriptional regulator